MSRVRRAAVMAMFWMTIQGLCIGLTLGAAMFGRGISPLVLVAQCAVFALVTHTNYSAIVRAGRSE